MIHTRMRTLLSVIAISFLMQVGDFVSAECTEKHWCLTSPSTKPGPNGEENEKCGRWARDCPCSCKNALVELEAREHAEKILREQEEARIAERDADLLAHVLKRDELQQGRGLDQQQNGNVSPTISVFVRSQNVPSDLLRVDYFRSLQQQFPDTIEVIFAHELEVEVSRQRTDASAWVVTTFVKHWFAWESTVTGGKPDWYLVVEPWTDIYTGALQHFLAFFDSSQKHFIGHGFSMKPSVLTLQHDYKDLQIGWPDAGFALSRAVFQELASVPDIVKPQNFFVTWEREFAFAVRKHSGISVLSLPKYFCDSFDRDADFDHCVTTARDKYELRVSHGVSYNDIVIAVKTTVSYHNQRLSILTQTWAQNTTHPVDIIFASDGPDPSFHPVVDLVAEWGPQVDQKKGHCAKAYAIMQHLLKHYPHKKVFVIADDDSMIHVPNLLKMVDAYDWSTDLYLGQRYGYGFLGTNLKTGYAYITMGGGLCMSKSFMESIVNNPALSCSAPDTPDDMQFGRWARRLGTRVIHDDGFHQAQLEYYADIVKRSQRVVSYHKFKKELDPETKTWQVTTNSNIVEYFRAFPDLAQVPPHNAHHAHHDASEL